MRHFILATAGHVDHGKSSLVKALTGIDPDRLPEEKARGITIDLGFAHISLPDPAHPGEAIHLGIIDVPGHEDFVKNMVAGVGSIDIALLVVAADDGWMPQTEEHLQILEYLDAPRAVIALTKADLLADTRPVQEHIREQLAGTRFPDAPIIATSIHTGAGLDQLVSCITALLRDVPSAPDKGKPRLAMDRAFSLRGLGTVVTGTLTGGTFRQNDEVLVQPGARRAHIRSIQSHNRQLEVALPGSRTALNIPDLPIATAEREGVARGDIVTTPLLPACTSRIDVLLYRSSRLRGGKGAARPLKDGVIVRLHHGTTNRPARLLLRRVKTLAPGEQALAQIRFEQPVFILAGERFIIRDWAEQYTMAGGLVLDAFPPDWAADDQRQMEFLEARASAPGDPLNALLALLRRDRIVPVATALLYSTFSQHEVAGAVQGAVEKSIAVQHGGFLVDSQTWKDFLARLDHLITGHHSAHPELPGLEIAALRQQFPELQPSPALFEALIAEYCRSQGEARNGVLRRRSHQQALPPQLRAAGEQIQKLLAEKPLEPPSRKELVPTAQAQQALRFLVETRQAVELGPDLVLSSAAYAKAVAAIHAFLEDRGRATASELKQALGTSRRVAIPLLEHLDKSGVTIREGDFRKLRS